MTNCIVQNNRISGLMGTMEYNNGKGEDGRGGAVCCSSCQITIVSSAICNNTVVGGGGAYDPCDDPPFCNPAGGTGGDAYGAGVYLDGGTARVINCTISGNRAAGGAEEADPIELIILPAFVMGAGSAGGGTVTVLPANALHLSNALVNLTAVPGPGWAFLQWLGDVTGTGRVASVVMNRDKSVRAVFGTAVITNVTGNGRLAPDPNVAFYPYGATIRVRALPQQGSYLAQWGNGVGGSENPISLVVTSANPTVSASFALLDAGQYTLTAIPSGHGSVVVSPLTNRYLAGQVVTLTAMPDPGEAFLRWAVHASGTQNPLTVSMTQNKTVAAYFTARPRLLLGLLHGGMHEEGFRLSLLGDLGGRYRIESASAPFSTWTTLAELTNWFGTVQFTDPSALNAAGRLYRATVAP